MENVINKISIGYRVAILKVIGTKNKTIYFLIDREDVEKVKQYVWRFRFTRATNTYYAETGKGKNRLILHRFLTNCPSGKEIDHINRITTDNRKENLKICNRSENCINRNIFKNNTTGYKNIYKMKNEKYNVRITRDKKESFIGVFNSLDEAIKARDGILNGVI